ncbi:MAG: hypothetical protein QOF10_391, partial [Kribbellaceae bacterium]|nr:hypothetical protein [Kribbellaceae bacterium]
MSGPDPASHPLAGFRQLRSWTFLSVEDGYDAPMKYLVFIYGDASGSSPEKQLQGLRDLTKLKDELARSGELVSA